MTNQQPEHVRKGIEVASGIAWFVLKNIFIALIWVSMFGFAVLLLLLAL